MTVSPQRPLIGIPTWSDSSTRHENVQLYGLNQSYVEALRAVGALPILIPLRLDIDTLRGIFEALDGLFLAGGNDISPFFYELEDGSVDEEAKPSQPDVDRDTTELTLTHWALDSEMPLFGVCRGMQLINVACGGTLYRDLHQQRPDLTRHDYFGPEHKRDQIRHQVTFARGSTLRDIFGQRAGVNSMHHQGINELGMDLTITATSTDGLPEAIESRRRAYVVGTQWHPEELMGADGRHAEIFCRFLSAASDRWRH